MRDVDDDLRAAVALAQLDRGLVDEALRLVVVRRQLDLDPSVERRVDGDLAGGEPDLQLDRACDVE